MNQKQRLILHLHGETRKAEDWALVSLSELGSRLNELLQCEFMLDRLNPEQALNVDQILSSATPRKGYLLSIMEQVAPGSRIVLLCPPTTQIVPTMMKENPMAQWGGTWPNSLAVVWEAGNKFILWHEVLHLVGADDCYDSAGRTTCELPSCVMQWAPTATSVGSAPFICRENLKAMRLKISEMTP